MDLSEQNNLKVDHEPAKLDEASKLMLKAAALIESRGWCQRTASIGTRMCIMGALNMAHFGFPRDGALPPQLESCFTRLNDALGMGPRAWNDALGRTQEEVIAKLRAVALSG